LIDCWTPVDDRWTAFVVDLWNHWTVVNRWTVVDRWWPIYAFWTAVVDRWTAMYEKWTAVDPWTVDDERLTTIFDRGRMVVYRGIPISCDCWTPIYDRWTAVLDRWTAVVCRCTPVFD
jgi:hypothetical protein